MIRVGLVGFGMAGRVFHAPLISSVEGLELAAVVERNSNNAAERYPGITTYRSLEELLADASIKLSSWPPRTRPTSPSPCRRLKPPEASLSTSLALTSDEVAQLPPFAGGIGLNCIPFHNRRWDNDFLTIHKLLHEHTLGRLVHFESNFDRWRPALPPAPGKRNRQRAAFCSISARISLIRHWRSSACPNRSALRSAANATAKAQTTPSPCASTTTPASRSRSAPNCCRRCPAALPHTRRKGNFWKWGLDPQEDALNRVTQIESRLGPGARDAWGTLSLGDDQGNASQLVPPISGDYRLFYQGVRDALLGNSKPPVAGIDAWRAARVLEYAAESARSHRAIECDWSAEPE